MKTRKIILFTSILFFLCFSKISFSKTSEECLAETIYHEGRNLSYAEQVLIASTVINRSNHKNFPKGICSVVYQKNIFRKKTVYQFTWTKYKNKKIKELDAYYSAMNLSKNVLSGKVKLNNKFLYFEKKNRTSCSNKRICHNFR